VLVVVGRCLLLLLGQRSLLYPSLFLTPQPTRLLGCEAPLRGLESFVWVVAGVLVGVALPVGIRSWFGMCVRQSIVVPRSSFCLEVLSVVLGVRTLVDMVGLLA